MPAFVLRGDNYRDTMWHSSNFSYCEVQKVGMNGRQLVVPCTTAQASDTTQDCSL